MKKPEHQWETRQHLASRRDRPPPPAFGDDHRAESFDLEFADGHVGRATLGLRAQEVDATSAQDPDLVHAVQCWLAARGQRVVDLRTPDGRAIAGGGFTLEDLGTAAGPTPERIVSLAPSNAELLGALGAFERVVACEDSSDFPSAVADCERLGPDLDPDLDRIASLVPDLVVSSLSVPGMERIVTGLRARSVPQMVLAPKSLRDVMDDARRVAARVGDPAAGERVCAKLERERDDLLARRVAPSRRVYLEWWPRPMFTPGVDCYSNELIRLAGGTNVFIDWSGSSVEVTAEEVVQQDPDVCFVSWCGVAESKLDPENLRTRPGFEELRAAKRGTVYALDEAFAGRPGPRMLEAARRMAARIRALPG